MKNNKVILVDENDSILGASDKLEVHKKGLLHRAYSVFVFNNRNELILQQRSFEKYHSEGLWSNTCCSHPQPGDDIIHSAIQRLYDEMGLHCILEFAFKFTYRSEFDNGLIEHEMDHVFIGKTNDMPDPNPVEVNAWRSISLPDLEASISNEPDKYTSWLKICLPELIAHLDQ